MNKLKIEMAREELNE